VVVASLAFAIAWVKRDAAANFYLIPSRAWELGVGALLALSAESPQLRGESARAASAAFGLLLIAVAVVAFDASTPYPSAWTLVPVLGTALVIAALGGDNPVLRILRTRWLVGIGLMSYSLYLWHQPILAFLRLRSLYEPARIQIIAGLALAFVLAWLSWRFVETPFRNRRFLSARQILTTAAVTSLFIAGIGLAGHLTDGFKSVSSERQQFEAFESLFDVNHGLDETCEQEFTLDPACRTSDRPEIAVWGDSYAMHIIDAIRASKADARLIQFTKSFCGPALDIAPMTSGFPIHWARGCMEFNRKVMNWITHSPSVRYVVLSSLVSQYTSDDCTLLTSRGPMPLDAQRAAQAFVATIERLQRAGKRVVLVSPTASFGGDIGRCLLRAHLRHEDRVCNFPESAYLEHRSRENAFMRQIAMHAPVIWLPQATCRAGTCETAVGGVPLYRDWRHYTHVGSALVGRRLNLYGQIVQLGDAEAVR
jgi:hypothetical protein